MDNLLKQFGFSTGEIIIYKALLKLGGAKVSEIASATNLKRTSCQEYVQSLEKKGFLNSTRLGNKYFYQSEDPDKFRQIIHERQYVADRLITDLRNHRPHEEWHVQTGDRSKVERDIRRAQRKGQNVAKVSGKHAHGAILNGHKIAFISEDKDLPVIEITSRALAAFHTALVHKSPD